MASAAGAPAAHTVLPDEILEEIFVRLDAAADLVRTSAACSSFHRIVSFRRFLRRIRSLHSPPVLGFINRAAHGDQRFLPVGTPHCSAPEARALVHAADFSFSFLPEEPHEWRFRHARDGRVLLSRPLEDFVVCDPLYRRYVKIPRIPDDLEASIPRTAYLSSVLAPAAGENDKEESFRVIGTVKLKGKIMVLVFSSCNQTWRGIISTISLPDGFIKCPPYYAHGCLYWMFYRKGYSLMLDPSEMKFSIIDLPGPMSAIVEAADGRLGCLAMPCGTIDLYCKNCQSNGVGAQEWVHNKLIPLPKKSGINYSWEIQVTAGRYLALVAHHMICDESPPISDYYVLDIETLLLEKLCTSKNGVVHHGFAFAGFPPPLALPSI